MKANDVVLAVNGAAIEEPRDLQRIIASTPVGQIVKLSVMREGKPTELSVTVGVYQGVRTASAAPAPIALALARTDRRLEGPRAAMRAVLLGTGSPPPNPARRGPATLLSPRE